MEDVVEVTTQISNVILDTSQFDYISTLLLYSLCFQILIFAFIFVMLIVLSLRLGFGGGH